MTDLNQIDTEMSTTDLNFFDEELTGENYGLEEIHGDRSTTLQPGKNIYSENYNPLPF